MKRLRKIALNLDRSDWPNQFGYDFYMKTRCLCNYLERRLKKEHIEIVDSTKLVIEGRRKSEEEFYINSSNIACLQVPFDEQSYDQIPSENELHLFIISFMKSNLLKIPNYPDNEVVKLINLIDEFENQDFQNNWNHKKKSIRKLKTIIYLDCELTLSEFKLLLNIEEQGQNIYSKVILKTDPDELAFHYKFKDLKVENDHIIVFTRTSETLFEVSLNKTKSTDDRETA